MIDQSGAELASRLQPHVRALAGALGIRGPVETEEQGLGVFMSQLDERRLRTAKAWVAASRAPGRAFEDETLFANPAWSLLLDLFISHAEQRRVCVTSACIAAGVPPTTGLRWIERLLRYGYLTRTADTGDGRRAFVAISDSGLLRMNAALDAAAESDRKLGLSRVTFTT